jgi:hypothetical protein
VGRWGPASTDHGSAGRVDRRGRRDAERPDRRQPIFTREGAGTRRNRNIGTRHAHIEINGLPRRRLPAARDHQGPVVRPGPGAGPCRMSSHGFPTVEIHAQPPGTGDHAWPRFLLNDRIIILAWTSRAHTILRRDVERSRIPHRDFCSSAAPLRTAGRRMLCARLLYHSFSDVRRAGPALTRILTQAVETLQQRIRPGGSRCCRNTPASVRHSSYESPRSHCESKRCG